MNLAPQAALQVTGTLTPDVTGTYAYKGLDSLGRPYYQQSKGGDLWSIAASGTAFLVPADGSSPVPGFLLIRGTTDGATQITAPDPHMSRWNVAEAMYYGLGYHTWSGSHSPLASLNPATGSLALSSTPTYGLRVGQPFFVYNLLEELTAPGDYFIDRTNARLYLRPLGDLPPTEVLLSTLQTAMVRMQGCQQIAWQGIPFEAAKDRLVVATDCQSVAFTNCQFRNSGGEGLLLGGSSNLVEACDFWQLGKAAAWVCGGDRMALTPSGTVIENSQFQTFGRLFWTYQPAINIQSFTDGSYNADCMGITIQHNEIHNGPHAAILFGGNENTIQYNLIHDVTQWTNDAAAIYTTGRDWGMQGNQIQFNLIRNCGGPLGLYTSGIYLDDVGSGVKITGNILYHAGPLFAIQHNGGRDVLNKYNISSGHWYGTDISNRGLQVVVNTPGSSYNLLDKLLHFNYQSDPWSTGYPNVAQIPNTWSQLQGSHWLEPEGSVCYGNLQFGSSPDVYHQTNYMPSMGMVVSYFSQVGGNLSQVDPLFTNPANLDFSLQPGSPMFTVPGFPGIDTTQIGIQH